MHENESQPQGADISLRTYTVMARERQRGGGTGREKDGGREGQGERQMRKDKTRGTRR